MRFIPTLLTPTFRYASALIATLVVVVALSAPGTAQPGPRRGPPDHNQARDAVRSGRALPLGDIIHGVQRYCPGRFLEAQLENRGGRLLYRVLILTDRGRRTTIMVDAGSGSIVGGRCN